MKEDVVLKSVLFGGFDKKEVLEFIERIQTEHFDESETIRQKDGEIESVKAKAAQLEDRLDSEKRRFSALAALNDEYCERIYDLEERIKEQNANFVSIQEDCDRLKKVEAQIGALLVDAILYSDKMTEKAKKAATSITADAKQNLVTTAEDVSRLSLEIAQISGSFRSDITALVEKVESLSANLCLFASRFENECDLSEEKAYDGRDVFEHFISEYNKLLPENKETAEETVLPETLNSEPALDEDLPDENILDESGAVPAKAVHENEAYDQPDTETITEEPDEKTDTETQAIKEPDVKKDTETPVINEHDEKTDEEIQVINEPFMPQEDDNPDELKKAENHETAEETGEIINAAIDTGTYSGLKRSYQTDIELAEVEDKVISTQESTEEIDEITEEYTLHPDSEIETFEEPEEILESVVQADGADVSGTLNIETIESNEPDITDITLITPDSETDDAVAEEAEIEKQNGMDETIVQPTQPDILDLPGIKVDENTEDALEIELAKAEDEQVITQNRSRDISESDVDELLRLFSE